MFALGLTPILAVQLTKEDSPLDALTECVNAVLTPPSVSTSESPSKLRDAQIREQGSRFRSCSLRNRNVNTFVVDSA
jgi:hypothetical protein